MIGTLKGPRAKVDRAKKHIAELQDTIGSLVFTHSANPEAILIEDDPNSPKRIYKVGRIPKVPEYIPAIIGDVIHNLRSALDLLLGQLILASGQEIAKEYFPIAWTRKKFESRCDTEIKGRVGKDPFDLICASEAYRGGQGDALWRVHALDIEDKHRLLFVVGLGFHGVTPTFPAEWFPPEAVEALGSLSLLVVPEDSMVPLKEGDVLFIDNDRTEEKTEPKFALFVAFSELEIVHGESVVPTVLSLAESVEGTIKAFAPFLSTT